MYFIGSEACRRDSGVIVGVFDGGNVYIPVILVFVANHGLFRHGAVDTFDAAVTTRGVGTCREFVYTEGKGVHPSHFGVSFKPWLVLLPWCHKHVRRRRYHSGSRRLS